MELYFIIKILLLNSYINTEQKKEINNIDGKTILEDEYSNKLKEIILNS